MQHWLTNPIPRSIVFFLFLPLTSPSCLSAPALRDEREEPLADASDHHHCCDWRHSDCCLGDGNSFAEQASPPKVQGTVKEKKIQSVVACSLHFRDIAMKVDKAVLLMLR